MTDLRLYDDFFNKKSFSSFPDTYQDNIGKGNSIFTGETNKNNSNFKVKELEVFK